MMKSKNKIDLIIAIIIFILFIFTNIYAVRKIFDYGTQVYLYDKLLVSFQVGGRPALVNELEKVLSEDKLRHELISAANFKKALVNINDPEEFLKNISAKQKAKISQLRNMRSAVFVLLLFIFLIRIIIKRLRIKSIST
ncbi:MAG: hypothetical protein Q7S42_05920 [Candidatus Omnitrophota bacterium]|nr:hypothetical protein [Candidatus Omnitrophota bacterium]